jgi:hypothetical protein
MVSVRNIITEALDRANLANRRQGANAELVEASYHRFCGILREYSDNNLITAYRGETDFYVNTEQVELGGVEIPCNGNITSVNSLFYKSEGAVDWFPMKFVALESFYDSSYNDYCFSWQPKGANKFTLYFKPRFAKLNKLVKVIYDEDIKLGIDDDVSLPRVYVELLTRSLAYKMSVDRPRASDTKRMELKAELEKLEEQIKANNADDRMLSRPSASARVFNMDSMVSGSFIFGR